MTLKGDAKFKGELICGLKKDIRNLVNFHASSRKSENLQFDWILLKHIKHIKFQMKKYRRVSLVTMKSDAKFEGKLTLGFKNDRKNLVNTNVSSGCLKICTLIGYFCRKQVIFELKKIQRDCVVKNDLWFQKRHQSFGKFSHKQLKVMLDKSSVYNVLAEGMYFLAKCSPSNFNFQDFLLRA